MKVRSLPAVFWWLQLTDILSALKLPLVALRCLHHATSSQAKPSHRVIAEAARHPPRPQTLPSAWASTLPAWRFLGSRTASSSYSTEAASELPSVPYADLIVGIPKETFASERRTALSPQNAALLLKNGFKQVIVEAGSGTEADFPDAAYSAAGATLVASADEVWGKADVVLKVRGPTLQETKMMRQKQTIVSFLQPAQNPELVEAIATRGATSFAMDMVPRISRAQVFDALSSMANIGRLQGCSRGRKPLWTLPHGSDNGCWQDPTVQGAGHRRWCCGFVCYCHGQASWCHCQGV